MKKKASGLSVATLMAGALVSCSALAAPGHAHDVSQLLEQEKASDNIYKAYFPNKDIARKAAISFHAQMLESHYDDGYLVMQLQPEEMKKLEHFGFTFETATDFIEQRNSILTQMQGLSSLGVFSAQSINGSVASSEAMLAGIPGYPCYETVEETFAAAAGFASSHPELAEWIDVGDSWQKKQGTGGFDIRVLKLTNKNTSGDKPKLFINSAIHAREYTTAPLALEFARWLVNGYGTNADATWIMDNHEVHLMLHTNPDGRKKAETGLSWRKNTNQSYCGSTSNSRGADLNRNFTFGWNSTNGEGSSGNQCNETYRGPSAGSEPEIQALEGYVRGLWPDRRGPGKNDPAPSDTSGIHLDIHSYSELVLWPWGDTSQAAPNGTALQTLGRKFAFFNGYSPQQSIGLYPTDGTSDGISYGELGVAAFTFELGTSFFQSCSTYESKIKPDNLNALIYAAKVVRTPYITPAGPDVTSLSLSGGASSGGVEPGTQVTLSASVTDTRFNNSNGTESTQNLTAAEYYVDTPPWANGAQAVALSASDGSYNSKTEGVTGVIDTTGMSEGKHIVYVRGKDASGAWGAVSAVFLVIDSDPTIPPAEYCDAASNSSSDEWISSVQVGGFLKTSGASKYSDFTEAQGGEVVSLVKGGNSVTFTPAFSGQSYKEYFKAWVDLNGDGDFDDAGEEVFDSGSASSSPASGTLTIPASASFEKTTMRVAMRYNAAPSACGTFNYGEVEDYTVSLGDGGEPPTDPDSYENDTDVSIPDNNATGVSSPIAVTRSGASGSVSVAVKIKHTYIGDLIVDLVHPDGTVYNLHNRTGGSTDDIDQTYTVDVGAKDSAGTWNLKVRDRANRDTGNIDSWGITFQ
ncbi:predicted carboxypeptidase [Hahella chejuensis KCTC 2396]|uniref:Predicted carboxypeptidase n=1 Tax=Hahella chejuensis (strain KCTC 2396) TaxID=349521 RepID=Q2SCR9_HAHCH|nr:M14 family zinc carboxypeptidase [Hahella chejuensis]ABC31555.1 predicted carboxypeptidase [Hahella chejuensis KCTC 2396]